MKRLGELLLERGAIDVNELHTGLEACHRLGGRLGTQLLRFGFVTEKDLLEALSQQFSVPFIPEVVLLKASVNVRKTLPLTALRKFQAVPFDRVHGRLMVAMANPRDPGALDELSSLTELHLEVCVATESAITKALDEVEAEVQEVQFFSADGAPIAEAESMPPSLAPQSTDEWWMFQAPDPAILLSSPPPSLGIERPLVSTFPGLTPVLDDGSAELVEVLDEASFREALQQVDHKDHVADTFLRFAAGYLGRLALFAVHRGKVVGWMARGQSVVTEDVESLEIPLKNPSVFRDVNTDGQPFAGALYTCEANSALAQCLGDPEPKEVVVVPLNVKERIVAFLVGDVPGDAASAVPLSALMEAAKLVNVAFEILILKNKLKI